MKFFTVILLLFISSVNHAQQKLHSYDLDKKSLEQFNEAVKLSRQKEYDKAIKEFEKLYKKHPDLHDAQLRIATIYFEKGDATTAKRLFDEVIAKDADYDPEVYYSAGMVAMSIKMYDAAAKYFGEFIVKNESDNQKTGKATKFRNDCMFRHQAIKSPKPFNPIKLSEFINTPVSEYLPVLSLDGKTMLFTRKDRFNEDIYVSYKNDTGDWSVATPIEEINSPDNESAASLSDDGNIMIFTKCNDKVTGFGSCDLYYAKKENDVWSMPKNLGEKINTPGWESNPCVFNNGNSIIFSSDRKGGIGGRDLWLISRMKSGKWGQAENLGERINSEGHEESPFLHPNGKTLFFRSDGHAGMGGFDIYISEWDEVKKLWSNPRNLGYPINTEGNEGALYVSADGKTAYFASDAAIDKSLQNNLDIFQFELPLESRPDPVSYVRLSVHDADTKMILHPTYSLINVTNKDTVTSGKVEGNSVLFALKHDVSYAFHLEQAGYIFYSENFDTRDIHSLQKEYQLKVGMQKLKEKEVSQALVLHNIFFKSGAYELLPESEVEIQKLYTLLNNNVGSKIKITGHTDNIGPDQDNLTLSQNRANAVINALIKLGINASRLIAEGKGEAMPIADNNSEEGRRQNRRTEFVVYYE